MWSKERDVAKKAALDAGNAILEVLANGFEIAKKGQIDLITDADLKAEEIILETIQSHFPQDGVLSEENGPDLKDSQRLWIIDPLDGTTNFAHGFPFVAVSIALKVGEEYVLGVVHNPFLKETFEASQGQGAYMNGERIRVSKVEKISDALLATGFPYYVKERPQRVLEVFKKMVLLAQGIRRPGSAAIDICYVAKGKFDGFWEEGLKPWDTAAGMVILKEAGGVISDYEGNPFDPFKDTLIAGNPLMHEQMLLAVRSCL